MCCRCHAGKVVGTRKLAQLRPGFVEAQVFDNVVWFRFDDGMLVNADLPAGGISMSAHDERAKRVLAGWCISSMSGVYQGAQLTRR